MPPRKGSSATTLPGAVVAYFWLAEAEAVKPYVLAVSAASFIYIAIADLIPSLHKQGTLAEALRQTLLLALGIATIALLHTNHGT